MILKDELELFYFLNKVKIGSFMNFNKDYSEFTVNYFVNRSSKPLALIKI